MQIGVSSELYMHQDVNLRVISGTLYANELPNNIYFKEIIRKVQDHAAPFYSQVNHALTTSGHPDRLSS